MQLFHSYTLEEYLLSGNIAEYYVSWIDVYYPTFVKIISVYLCTNFCDYIWRKSLGANVRVRVVFIFAGSTCLNFKVLLLCSY